MLQIQSRQTFKCSTQHVHNSIHGTNLYITLVFAVFTLSESCPILCYILLYICYIFPDISAPFFCAHDLFRSNPRHSHMDQRSNCETSFH